VPEGGDAEAGISWLVGGVGGVSGDDDFLRADLDDSGVGDVDVRVRIRVDNRVGTVATGVVALLPPTSSSSSSAAAAAGDGVVPVFFPRCGDGLSVVDGGTVVFRVGVRGFMSMSPGGCPRGGVSGRFVFLWSVAVAVASKGRVEGRAAEMAPNSVRISAPFFLPPAAGRRGVGVEVIGVEVVGFVFVLVGSGLGPGDDPPRIRLPGGG
jgi:hypothetical protein